MAALTLLQLLVLVLVSGGSSGSDISGQKNITAILGENIVLTCRAADSKPVTVIDWTRRDLRSERVFLFRDNNIYLDNQHEQFKNRVELQDRQMKNGDVSLVLKSVTAADRGIYECKVVQPGVINTATTICIINLDVVPRSRILPGNKEDDLGNGGNEAGSPGLLIGLTVILHLSVRFWF
ncbi:coxsackievirus and adenovirus receptor homolog [Fundulus heteroclitus]|uniref:coxsackievirus and adenovirus receptor homolog n=1 Tax=Fundulus heteroclitus TaxID=8078 RepID=UPI00165CC8F3|nr:coxsackievirus and adenovirus receptor homolog [Fundulus heteroclitus]